MEEMPCRFRLMMHLEQYYDSACKRYYVEYKGDDYLSSMLFQHL